MKIIIVGGGTAGWLTTFVMSKIRPNHEYINISSSEIPTVGVGEGITGLFRRILTDPFFGINEFDFAKEAEIIPKLAIKFNNWSDNNASFYSPIEGTITSQNYLDTSLFFSILDDRDIDDSSITGYLCKRNKTSFSIKNGGINFLDYGLHAYHIDNYKTGKYFKNLSIQNGVTCIDSKIENIISDDGKIKKLILKDGQSISGDFFVDCSGYAKLLSKHLNIDSVDYSKYLPLNEVIVFNLKNDDNIKYPYTNANAMNNGWMFEIFKQKSTQRGYSYCSDFCTREEAEKELREYFNQDICVTKHWKFKSQRLKTSFNSNCVSIGLSNFSVEPLQSTQIHCAVAQINDFMRNCFNDDIEKMMDPIVVKQYNNRISKLCDGMVDFIMMHYTGLKTNTKFWQYVTYEKPTSDYVKNILHLSKTRLTRWDDFDTFFASSNQILWNPILAGLGHFDKNTIANVLNTWNLPEEFLQEELQNHYSMMNNFCKESSDINDVIKFLGK